MKIDLAKIFSIAARSHAQQFRRDGLTPYFSHPVRVCDRVQKHGLEAQAVALLHDTLEDTPLTQGEILHVAGQTVYDAVLALTHYSNESYDDYLQRVKKNDLARIVKVADILDNLSDDPSRRQIVKYARALLYLIEK